MINNIVCLSVGGANTGFGSCVLNFDKIVGFFLVSATFALAEQDLVSDDTLKTALLAGASADLLQNRIFPVHNLLEITDSSTEPTKQTFGYGSSVITQQGVYDWTFPFIKGGLCLLTALQEFNDQDIRPIFYDSSGRLFGWRQGNTIKGIPLNQFYANDWKPATGAAVQVNSVNMNFGSKFINREIGFYQATTFGLEEIKGLQSITLYTAAARAANVIKIKAKAGCAGIDLYAQYSAQLAAPANWRVTRNGAVVTVTSAAIDVNLSAWTLTLDTADPDYNAAGPFQVTLAPVSILTAAGIVGYEGKTLTVA
jgi:hypothetical protein